MTPFRCSSGHWQKAEAAVTLDELPVGGRGRIVALSAEPALLQRLMEMGVLEGDEVEVITFAPLGDPVEVRLGDSRLSLRREEAARVEVLPLP
jgi:ferrous iron transport protein A